jgi:hypothetical protein
MPWPPADAHGFQQGDRRSVPAQPARDHVVGRPSDAAGSGVKNPCAALAAATFILVADPTYGVKGARTTQPAASTGGRRGSWLSSVRTKPRHPHAPLLICWATSSQASAALCCCVRAAIRFTALHDAMSVEVRTRIGPRLTDPAAASVTSAVFLEVWMLARFHTTPGIDVHGWILGIADRRAGERGGDRRAGRSTAGPVDDGLGVNPQTRWWAAMLAVDDRRADLALTALLAAQPAEPLAGTWQRHWGRRTRAQIQSLRRKYQNSVVDAARVTMVEVQKPSG